MSRLLHIALSPNADIRDAGIALRQILQPWTWTHSDVADDVAADLTETFGARSVFLTTSGRWALATLLRSLGLSSGDEVVVQAFTCVSVPAAVQWTGLHPVYVDIDPKTYAMDPDALSRAITPRSRVVIVQHTFGIPADLDPILRIARERNLIVIEDCAHALGARYRGRFVGTFGDAALLSFGRDKAISSVFGGGVLVHAPERFPGLAAERARLAQPSRAWVFQQLLHPLLTVGLARPLYPLHIGKGILRGAQALRLLSKAVSPEERHGKTPSFPAATFPSALAALARHQLRRLAAMNEQRRALASLYAGGLAGTDYILPEVPADREAVYLRYPVQCTDPKRVLRNAQRQNVILGDWYRPVIAPAGTDLRAVGYEPGTCPIAERVSIHVLNLPTMPWMTEKDVDRVVGILRTP